MINQLGRIALAAALLTGCGGTDKPSPPLEMATIPPDMSLPVGKLCSDPRADPYTLPLSKSSANRLFTVSLLDSDPSPPIIGTNNWTLTVADATGTAVDGATLTAKPWMPDHGHGTSVIPTISATSAPGQYAADSIYLFMAGVWEVTFTIQPQTGAADTVMFTFCLSDS